MEETRMKIPLLFGFDVIHGFRTIFPVPLAMAASWDTDLAENAQAVAAQEASAVGINWTFAPMVDIARDARWGRIVEGAGEDPFLGAAMALSIPAMTWLKQASLLLVLAGVAVVGLAIAFWPRGKKASA